MQIRVPVVLRTITHFLLITALLTANVCPSYGDDSRLPPMYRKPTATDLHEMMGNLASSSFSELERKRMAAVIFVHEDVYRAAVIRGEFPDADEEVKTFLKAKEELMEEVAHRMNVNYRNRFGQNLKAPIIPFECRNILSDDDIIMGSGKVGQVMEGLFVDSLDEIIKERVLRPMTAADRARVDVNGLSWDMTNEGALQNFWHKEKYINPQSGFANQVKLSEAGDKVKVLTFDDQGRMVRLTGDEAKKAIAALSVDKPLAIPGIDLEKGSGSMSDYMRMAEIHQVKFQGRVSEEDIAHFIRNQKYTDRVAGDFNAVALKDNPELAQKYASFLETSKRIRGQATMAGVAQVLEMEYKIKIVDANGIVDLEKLTQAMKLHQQRQITEAMPQLTGAVMKNEAYKMLQWIKGEPVGSARRVLLRKQLALTCAAMTDQQRTSIASDLEKMEAPPADKAFLKRAVVDDAGQIHRYAELLEIPREDLAKALKIEGDNVACVDFIISKNAKISKAVDAIAARPGGSRFAEFLKSKTAKALNLDVMLGDEASKSDKFLTWGLLLFSVGQAYYSSGTNEEALKNVAMAMFERIPFVASVLRFSEADFKQAFKEFCMDVMPPLALANVAGMFLNYAAQSAKESFKESVWEGLVREALRDFDKDDFEKTDSGYYRLKDREGYLQFLEEVAPGMGRVAKLASMVEPEVEARMSRDQEVQNNNAALHTLQYLEEFDLYLVRVRYGKQFDLEQIKNRVWEKGMPPAGAASPVERVAAKIILDNLSVRAKLYTQVLEDFIDRIERRFNELKGEMDPDFDPSAIIVQTMAILKQDYENAPKEILESPWGKERLDAGYRERVAYLKDYSPKDKDELDIRREMQQIIEDFRKFIKDLELGVSLYEEMQSLNLTTYAYGGERSQEPTGEVLLGDVFRVGISAKVRPSRATQKWTVFYYLFSQKSGDLRLIKGVPLSSGAFNPGNEGLWIIEPPEPKTMIRIERNLLEEEFDQEGTYEIISVFAFGGWADPMKEVGYNALVSPIDYAELFSKDKAAFAGAALNVSIVRAEVSVKVPRYVYRNEVPKADVFLKVPPYAREYAVEAKFKITPPSGSEPGLDPKDIDRLSTDPESPTRVRVLLPEKDPAEGTYVFEAEAEVPVLPRTGQPLPRSAVFDYSKDANPETPADAQGESLEELLRQMEGFRGQSDGLLGQNKNILNTVTKEARELTNRVKGESSQLESVKAAVNGLSDLETAIDQDRQKLDQAAREAYNSAQTCGQERSDAQANTLKLCELAAAIKGTDVVNRLQELIQEARGEYSEARQHAGQFDAGLSQARDHYRQCQDLQARIQAQQKKIDEIKASLTRLRNSLELMDADQARLDGQAGEMGENVEKMQNVSSAAAGVAEKARDRQTVAPTREGDRILRLIEQAYQKIQKNAGAIEPLTAKAREAAADAGAALGDYRGRLTSVETLFEQKKQTVLSPQKLKEVADKVEECRASFDAADVFTDSVAETMSQADICMSRAEELFAGKTSPESQVSQADCSGFPGTHPEWDARMNRVRCVCAASDIWVEARSSCVDKKQYAVETTDCSRFGYAEARWSEPHQKALCFCQGNFVWNAGQTQCIDCNAYFQLCQGSLSAGDLGGAQACAADARNCPWAGDMLAQIDQIVRQQQCQQLEAQILGLAQQVPQVRVEQANALMDQALGMGCMPSPAVYQALSAAMQRQQAADYQQQQAWEQEQERQRQEAIQRQQQQQQAIQDMMQNMMGILDAQNQNNRGYQQPYKDGRNQGAGQGEGGTSTTAMSGRCRGSIQVSPTNGYVGTTFTTTIYIEFPESQYVTRVTTDNPLCHNCDASKSGPNTWTLNLPFAGSKGSFVMKYIAFDSSGRELCSGASGSLQVLGSR